MQEGTEPFSQSAVYVLSRVFALDAVVFAGERTKKVSSAMRRYGNLPFAFFEISVRLRTSDVFLVEVGFSKTSRGIFGKRIRPSLECSFSSFDEENLYTNIAGIFVHTLKNTVGSKIDTFDCTVPRRLSGKNFASLWNQRLEQTVIGTLEGVPTVCVSMRRKER